MTEILDIFDENMTHLGSKPRPDVHRDGDWHQVFHCWVIYRDDDGNDTIIFQKRGADKAMYPNLLDVSAAGHLEAGESGKDGVREVREELGLSLAAEDLIPAGRRISTARYDGLIDLEMAHVYMTIHAQSLTAYDYQREEVAGLVAVPVEAGLHLLEGDQDAITVAAVGLGDEQITIRAEDFVPRKDYYFTKILLLARRCLAGEPYLYI